MAVEVPCPSCQAVLRAPDDAAGKRVKCKKCEHRFVIPGAAKPDSVGESQMLSVVDVPSIPAAVAPAVSAGPVNSFSFDTASPGEPAPMVKINRPVRKGPNKWVLILGGFALLVLLGCGGVGAGVYFVYLKPSGTAVVQNTPTGPGQPNAASKGPPGKGSDTKGPNKTSPKGKEKEKDKEPNAASNEPAPVEPLVPVAGPMNPPPKGPAPKGPAPKTPAQPMGGGAGGKTFTMPGPPDAAGKLIAPARLKIPMELPASSIRDVVFIPSNPPLVGVLWNSAIGFQGSGAKDTVDVYSSRTMIRTDRFEYPVEVVGSTRLFDLAPEGAKFVVPTSKEKLYLHNLEAKAKLLDPFHPFAQSEPKRAGPPAAARFVTANTLLIFDSQGAVDVWDLTTKQRTASGPPLTTSSGRVAVSEPVEGKVYVFAGERVQAMNAQGQPAGPGLVLGGSGFLGLAIGLDAAGTRAAVGYQAPGKPQFGLAVVDLRTNSVTGQLALPELAGLPVDVGCFGNGTQATIITNNRNIAFLYDTEQDTVAASLSAAPGKPPVQIFSDGVSGRICWIMPDPADPKKSLLLGVDANFDGYPSLVEEARGSRKPVPLSLRAEGLAK